MDIRRLQLATERYSLAIGQTAIHCAVDVRPTDNPTGGYITALKQLDVVSLEVQPAEVVFNVSFARRRPDQVEAVCDWLMIVADLAKQLDLFFADRKSFGTSITIKAHGVSLVIQEADVAEALG